MVSFIEELGSVETRTARSEQYQQTIRNQQLTNETMSSQTREDNLWAHLPPLHTIKSEELVRYQIVDWDPNNPHHPRYLAGHILIKSLFRRDHYYWIACSNPLPKDKTKNAPPIITVSPPASAPTPALSAAPPSTSSSMPSSNFASPRADPQEQQTKSFAASASTIDSVSSPYPAMKTVATIPPPGSPADKNYTDPGTIPIKTSICSSPSAPEPGHPSFRSHNPPSSLSNQNGSANDCSSTASSPDVPTSQKKRKLKATEQKGRNVRPDPSGPPLKADGWPVGVEKPADGWANLGTFSWHYWGSSERADKS
ncbi:hypothetical protein ONS95_012498 [Cadophora gregata]|uniref:uncharacterized protein n=1 Tax=Cadophora gregata TaxID=51156 RepID=UPI0026DD27D3|nr:uncharacterized protein ONS95_012498 [Cadophora gregata]KAK0118194.1 hypothetical protein ONS95_012498 [Cadophora gregata]KAK0123267.1 hypothetical protein ONS96_010265 [Cadophora gregata f. sp. sojae]